MSVSLRWWLGLSCAGLALSVTGADAREVSEVRGLVHVNGYTHHFAAPGANDNLLGLGVTWYDRRVGRFRMAWEADLFRDSGREVSGYLGRSWTLPLRIGNIGVTGALMYHRNFASRNRLSLMPVALPYWETPGRRLRMRLYYVPPVRRASDHQIAFQLLTPF